jgi:alkylation response protein AidB-like acyl-CoA dehydrogenase
VRDGDEYVINGQKIWTSNAQNATHIWLAARTDPKAPKHRGISMFIIPMSTPGISVRAIPMSSGERTNETFFEDVRVPADTLVGEEGRGWYTTANALDYERVAISPLGGIAREFDDMIEYLKAHRRDLIEAGAVRRRLAELKMELHVQRALKTKNSAIIANGQTPNQEASMTKVFASELQQRIPSVFMELVGRYGAVASGLDGLPLRGELAKGYTRTPVLRFGGGTNEVQRNIIAQRGLGLPR